MFLMHAGFYVNKCYSGAVWMKTEGVLTARKKYLHIIEWKKFLIPKKKHTAVRSFL